MDFPETLGAVREDVHTHQTMNVCDDVSEVPVEPAENNSAWALTPNIQLDRELRVVFHHCWFWISTRVSEYP
jgi:hypothetical protein